MSKLECKICEEKFTDIAGKEIPRILTGCGHTICEICCGKLYCYGKVRCPFDNRYTYVRSGNVQDLKRNYMMMDLIEEEQKKIKLCENKDSNEYEEEKKLGIKCDEDQTHVAVLYCQQCETNLCKICFYELHSSKTLSSHSKTPVSEKPDPVSKCPAHPQSSGELLCKESGCTAAHRIMCVFCFRSGDHKGHAHCLLEEECGRLRDELNAAAETSDRYIKQTTQVSLDSIKALISYSSDNLKMKVDTINRGFEKVKSSIEQQRRQAVSQFEDKFSKWKKEAKANSDKVMAAEKHLHTQRLAVKNMLELKNEELLKADVDSAVFNCRKQPVVPAVSVHADNIRMSLPVDCKATASFALGYEVIFYPMRNDDKMNSILSWINKNSKEIKPEGDSCRIYEYKKKNIRLWVNTNNKLILSDGAQFVILADPLSSNVNTVIEEIKVLMAMKTGNIVIAINKERSSSRNELFESSLKASSDSQKVHFFYYDHKFEATTLSLLDFVLRL